MITRPPPANAAAPTTPQSGSDSPAPAATPPAAPAAVRPHDAKAEREARLAAALRENLKRRKAQARARREPGETGAR